MSNKIFLIFSLIGGIISILLCGLLVFPTRAEMTAEITGNIKGCNAEIAGMDRKLDILYNSIMRLEDKIDKLHNFK